MPPSDSEDEDPLGTTPARYAPGPGSNGDNRNSSSEETVPPLKQDIEEADIDGLFDGEASDEDVTEAMKKAKASVAAARAAEEAETRKASMAAAQSLRRRQEAQR